MKAKRQTRSNSSSELVKLRSRLAEAEEALRAIRNGEVDAVVGVGVGVGKRGRQVFTLEGTDHVYRLLIESMNEGALTLTADRTILYANECFARMVKQPLEQVIGSSFHRFLSAADLVALRTLLKQTVQSGSKIQVLLKAGDGSQVSAQISIRPLAKQGSNQATIGMVVTDMTEIRRNEEMLRALSHRLVQVQESERGGVALELHDRITQLLCAILVRSKVQADKLSPRDLTSKRESLKLIEMLGEAAEEVESISRKLRPSVLEQLGLVAVLHDASTKFTSRTGVLVNLICGPLLDRLPAETELTLYRIFQEALKNVEQHARAPHVTVSLTLEGNVVRLVINDDGIGFDLDHHPGRRKEDANLGLLGMRERATYVGGVFELKSVCRAGTEIEVRIPLPPHVGITKGTH